MYIFNNVITPSMEFHIIASNGLHIHVAAIKAVKILEDLWNPFFAVGFHNCLEKVSVDMPAAAAANSKYYY